MAAQPFLRRLGLAVAHKELGGTPPSALVEQPSLREPSSGPVGRLELNDHWEALSVGGRKALLRIARAMVKSEERT